MPLTSSPLSNRRRRTQGVFCRRFSQKLFFTGVAGKASELGGDGAVPPDTLTPNSGERRRPVPAHFVLEHMSLITATVFLTSGSLIAGRGVLAIFALSRSMAVECLTALLGMFVNLLVSFITNYGQAAIVHPIITKAVTSGVAYALGDLIAQVFEGGRRIESLDGRRCMRNGIAGVLVHGPVLHFQILFFEGPLESLMKGASAWQTLGCKILLDQTIFSILMNFLYALVVGILGPMPLGHVMGRTRQTLISATMSSWRFWPFVHLVTYSQLMPIQFKVLWNDIAEVVWVAILSVITNARQEMETREEKPGDVRILP